MPYSNVTPPVLPDFSPVTGYSYNGVELPVPPNDFGSYSDEYIYHYIASVETVGGTYHYKYYASSSPFTVRTYSSYGLYVHANSYYGDYYFVDGEWTLVGDHYSAGALNDASGLIWADHDIVNAEDNTVYLAASDPIPVQSYPYYVLVFDYVKGAEDWYQVHLYYSGTPYTYDGTHVTNAEGIIRKDVYDGSAWSGEITSDSAPTLTPGFNGDVYQRIYTNHDILDGEGNVWLAADSVTPVEEETGSGFDLKSFLTGLALGLSGKPLPLAPKEPTAYSYNGVVLPKLPE